MPVRTEQEINAARNRVYDNAASFNSAVQDFIDSVGPTYLVPLHKELHLQGLRGIVQKTPVKTGRARANWQSAKGTEPSGQIGVPGGQPIGQFSQAPSLSVAGNDAVERGLRALAGLQPYSVTYITNTLPYVEALEAGSSDQTPKGMVAVTIAELETQFR